VAPCTPVSKPAPAPSGPFSGISAIDLVKVACSTRKRARNEEELATSSSEEVESAATPQSKHAKPRAGDGGSGFGQKGEGAGRKPKLVAMVGGVASTMVGGTNDAWQRIA
jgi:hypothetical protein